MIVLLLALAQPMPPQPLNSIATDAMRCAATSSYVADRSKPITMTSIATYYLMRAAVAEPGGKSVPDRVGELSDRLTEFVPDKDQKAIAADCARRMPLALATVSKALPADPFARDVTCLGAIGVVLGAAQGYEKEQGDSQYSKKWEPILNRFSARLTDEALAARGLKEDTFSTYMWQQLIASMQIGNVEAISNGCAALPEPAK